MFSYDRSIFRGPALLVIILVCFTLAVFSLPKRHSLFNSQLCKLRWSGLCFSEMPISTSGPLSERLSDKESGGLAIAESIYVISLSRRTDRRQITEKLRKGLDIQWRYIDALDKKDALVDTLTRFALVQREYANTTLNWPSEGSIQYNHVLTDVLRRVQPPNLLSLPEPLLCAKDDSTVPWFPNTSTVPYHMVLSRGMLACWYSHVSLMADIARSTKELSEESWDGRTGTSIIFEDDIDVEWDIRERLLRMWPDLPHVWDIVFLGHCWSDESRHPALAPNSPLHPSHKPKCTHAYVLSPFGARRLLTYLTYPPFAFSRALDQAIAHLVASQRLRAYSVVPAIVTQRRCAEGSSSYECEEKSDIWFANNSSTGSRWRDELRDSALTRLLSSTDDEG